MINLSRMWINQPSTLQPFHHMHGTNVLACLTTDKSYQIWFLSGDVVSMQIPKLALSKGWTK